MKYTKLMILVGIGMATSAHAGTTCGRTTNFAVQNRHAVGGTTKGTTLNFAVANRHSVGAKTVTAQQAERSKAAVQTGPSLNLNQGF